MDQIIMGLVALIGFLALLAALGMTRPSSRRAGCSQDCASVHWRMSSDDHDRLHDDYPWQPHALGEVMGYASLSQGGHVVGYTEVRRFHLRPGWQSGQQGMRPYTTKARAELEREQGSAHRDRRS